MEAGKQHRMRCLLKLLKLPMDKNAMIGVSQFTEQKNCDTPILYFKKKLKEVYDERHGNKDRKQI